jgi:surface antigen
MRVVAKAASLILSSLAVTFSVPAAADPPAHAPAHGWRAKHVGHTGYEWTNDYGIVAGSCDHRAIATVIGGVVGGAIANRVAEPENRTVATIIGIAAGALIGNRIGREFDKADEACVGHALELGGTGRVVAWRNESTGVSYQMTPGADRERDGLACREFRLTAVAGSERSTRQGLACESERGGWQVVQ